MQLLLMLLRDIKKMYLCDGYEIRMVEISIYRRRNIVKSNVTIDGSLIYVYRTHINDFFA